EPEVPVLPAHVRAVQVESLAVRLADLEAPRWRPRRVRLLRQIDAGRRHRNDAAIDETAHALAVEVDVRHQALDGASVGIGRRAPIVRNRRDDAPSAPAVAVAHGPGIDVDAVEVRDAPAAQRRAPSARAPQYLL